MASVITCTMAVRWKKGPAPIVVTANRVVMARSFLVLRDAICTLVSDHERERLRESLEIDRLTRDRPGDGFTSVLTITVSLSVWKGL